MVGTTLQWKDAPHDLVLSVEGDHVVGVLHLRKKRGNQDISITFPRGITLEQIHEAWVRQREQWREILFVRAPFFVAVRIIRISNLWSLVWHVVHHQDAPLDACSVLPTPAWSTP